VKPEPAAAEQEEITSGGSSSGTSSYTGRACSWGQLKESSRIPPFGTTAVVVKPEPGAGAAAAAVAAQMKLQLEAVDSVHDWQLEPGAAVAAAKGQQQRPWSSYVGSAH